MDHSLVTAFAHGLAAGSTTSSPLRCAQERGWIDAKGGLTAEGQTLAQALSRRTGMISDFRIG